MKIFRPPVEEISKNLNSTERELDPQCGSTTIEVAEIFRSLLLKK